MTAALPASAKKLKRPAKPRKPIYLRCERLIRPDTGEEIRGWVAATQWDARAMKDRGYKAGDEVRALFAKRRNPKFNRLAHQIGALAVDHVEGFEEMDTHDALKKLQRESGVCCEEIEIDLGPLGKVKAKQALSIAFDEMPEEEFSKLVHGICKYLRDKYAGVPPGEIAEIIAAVEDGHA